MKEEAEFLESIAEESTKEVAKTGFTSMVKSLIPAAFAGLSATITPAGAAGAMVAGAVLTAGVAACGYAGYKLYQKNKERKPGESFKEAVLKPVAKEMAGKVKSLAIGATVGVVAGVAVKALSSTITPIGGAAVLAATGVALLGANVMRKKFKSRPHQKERVTDDKLTLSKNKVTSIGVETKLENAAIKLEQGRSLPQVKPKISEAGKSISHQAGKPSFARD